MDFVAKNFEKIKEDLISTYKNLGRNINLAIDFDENLVNNYFSWNQDIVSIDRSNELSQNSHFIKTDFLKSYKPAISDLNQCDGAQILKKMRPSADLSFCYQLFHEPLIHNKYKAEITSQNHLKIDVAKIYDDFEKSRVLALIGKIYRGIVVNLLAKIEEDISSASPSSLDLMVIGQIYSQNILPQTQIFIDDLHKNLAPKICQKILNLCDDVNDQEAYAKKVKSLIEDLLFDPQDSENDSANSAGKNDKKNKNDEQNFGAETIKDEAPTPDNPDDSEQENAKDVDNGEQKEQFEIKNVDQILAGNAKIQDVSEDGSRVEFVSSYQIFTNQFDEVIYPKNFTNKSELESLRNQLDLKISKLNSISKKMSLKLKRKLLSKKNNYFGIDSTAGLLNRKKFSQIIMSPLMEDIWINIRNHEYNDTALTILLDNSGSMRGNPIVMSALACQIIAEILEKFSIKTEIIGFTTSDWRGGRARKLWEMSGRKKNPGRLNEVRHIIYKSFGQSFKKAKINLGLMLKEGMLKENIDGEALLFARSRLMQQSEKRKILMVISDGTPVDDSTASANDTDILSQHLKHVINVIEKQGKIEIIGVGIGHTTDDFYKNSITIKTLDELGDVMIDKIINVL